MLPTAVTTPPLSSFSPQVEDRPQRPLPRVKLFNNYIYLHRVPPPQPLTNRNSGQNPSSARRAPAEDPVPSWLTHEDRMRLRQEQDQECLDVFRNWYTRPPTMELCRRGILATVQVEMEDGRYQDVHILRPKLKWPGQPKRPLDMVGRLQHAFKDMCHVYPVPVPPQVPRHCKRGG